MASLPKFLTALFVSLILIACQDQQTMQEPAQPGFLKGLQSKIKSQSPEADPEEWLLAHVDVETTGLIPGYHEMIDIGMVITDLAGREIDSLFIRIQPRYPERTSPMAQKVNAFDSIKWKQIGALQIEEAVSRIRDFHHKTCGDRPVLMVAFNSHFDAAFLDHLFRAADSNWRTMFHYFILDIPSIAWGMGYKDLTMDRFMEEYQIPDEPHVAELHTGITGAKLNARIYRALMDNQK